MSQIGDNTRFQPDEGAIQRARSKPQLARAAVPEPPDDGRLTAAMILLNETVAREIGVVPDVHPKDIIYWFCCMHPQLTLEHAINYYFRDGATSAAKVRELISGFEELDHGTVKLLEFASGYGCVSRHLKNDPRIDLVSWDIHAEAIGFLRDRIGVKAHPSERVPERFSVTETYDVIFALSFFSHMPKSSFGRWLRALFNAVSIPGYLVFTTHGLKSCEGMGITPQDIPADGFWCTKKSEQLRADRHHAGLRHRRAVSTDGRAHRGVQARPLVGPSGFMGGQA